MAQYLALPAAARATDGEVILRVLLPDAWISYRPAKRPPLVRRGEVGRLPSNQLEPFSPLESGDRTALTEDGLRRTDTAALGDTGGARLRAIARPAVDEPRQRLPRAPVQDAEPRTDVARRGGGLRPVQRVVPVGL